MPVEIKELIIRAHIGEDSRQRGTVGADPGRPSAPPSRGLSQGELDRIVSTCVERVLRAIKKSQER